MLGDCADKYMVLYMVFPIFVFESLSCCGCWYFDLLRHCLIETLFKDQPEADRLNMLNRLLSTGKPSRKSPVKSNTLHHVVNLLQGDQDEKAFADLRDEVEDQWRQDFVISRVGLSKEKASALTPGTIKMLKPPLPNCYLVWQFSRCSFQGYYPIMGAQVDDEKGEKPASKKQKKTPRRRKTHYSTSMTYGEKRTQLSALSRCVQFLWKHHEKSGGEPWMLTAVSHVFNGHCSTIVFLIVDWFSRMRGKSCPFH